MDIPIANFSEIKIDSGIIIEDNCNNLTFTEDKPKQLKNQIAIQDNCVISITPSSRNSFFFITLPNPITNEMNDSSLITNQYNRKLKLLCSLIILIYISIFAFTLIILYGYPKWND
jgi:hypothetical protein